MSLYAENPGYTKGFLSVESGIGQNIALRASPTAGILPL